MEKAVWWIMQVWIGQSLHFRKISVVQRCAVAVSTVSVQVETHFNPTFQIVAIAVGEELGIILCL